MSWDLFHDDRLDGPNRSESTASASASFLVSQADGRGGQIRTDDFLLPKQALYQAELRPVRERKLR